MSLVPRPAPARHSAIAAAFPSLSIATGSPSRSRITSRNGTSVRAGCSPSRSRCPARWSIRDGIPNPTATDALVEQLPDGGLEPVEERLLGLERASAYSRCADRAVARDEAGEDLRPADVDTDHVVTTGGGYHNPPDAVGEKPYRVYRGGRAKGKVPDARQPERNGHGAARASASGRTGAGCAGSRSCIGLFLVLVARLGARELLPVPRRRLGREQAARPQARAGARRPARQRDGHPPARHRPRAARRAASRRTAPTRSRSSASTTDRHRIAYLSIPRDLVRRDPRPRRRRRSTRRCSSAGRRSRSDGARR